MAKIIAVLTSDFALSAMQDALAILDADQKAEGFRQKLFLERAGELSENPQASADWLAGLAAGLIKGGMSKGQAAVRKSEAGSVFKAYHVSHESVEALTGTYHQFIDGCRTIVNKATGTHSDRASTKGTVKTISDKDKASIVKRVLEADNKPSTLLELMKATQTAFIKAAGVPEVLVRQTDNLAIELMKSTDKFYATLGEKISKLTQSALEHAEKVRAKQAQEQAKTESVKAERHQQLVQMAKPETTQQPAVVNG